MMNENTKNAAIETAEETTKPRRGRRKMTDEEKAAAKAKREAEKAAAAAADKVGDDPVDTGDTDNEQQAIDGMVETKGKEKSTRVKKIAGGEIVEETAPKKITRRSAWSTDVIKEQQAPVIKEYMYIEIELLSEALGMMPSNPNLMDDYISSKAPDAMSRDEEVAAYGVEEVQRSDMTIWPKNTFQMDTTVGIPRCINDRTFDIINEQADLAEHHMRIPFIYDYQLKGMVKDATGLLSRFKNNQASTIKAYKKVIDGGVFMWPRHVGIIVPPTFVNEFGETLTTYDENGYLRTKQRALRTSGPTGERNAIAKSEIVPAGSTLKFRIGLTDPSLRDVIIEILDYGTVRGLGQWRNSGIGIYRWRELNPEYIPYSEIESYITAEV